MQNIKQALLSSRTFSLRIGLHLSCPFIARILYNSMLFGTELCTKCSSRVILSLYLFLLHRFYLSLSRSLCTLHHSILFSRLFALLNFTLPPLLFAFCLSTTFSFCLRILTSMCFILPCFLTFSPNFPPPFFNSCS